MSKRTKSYESGLYDRLRDPAYAKEYLRAALEDHDEGADAVFLLALRDIAKANHMTYVAEATGLNRESLYKMLSRRGNPGINSLKAVLNAVGLELSVELAREKPSAVPQGTLRHVVVSADDQQGCAVVWHSGSQSPPPQYEAGLENLANPPPQARKQRGNLPPLILF